MGQRCSLGLCGDFSSDEITMEAGGALYSKMNESQRASTQIKHDSSSHFQLAEEKEKLLDTTAIPEIGDVKNVALSHISRSIISMPSEESMSSFSWAGNGIGCDGLERNTDKTREDVGMLVLKAMEACGANVEGLSTHGGRTSLMFAVLSKDLEYVKQLVARRADVLKENDQGETALTLAKSLSRNDIYDFLQNVSTDFY